MFSIVFGLAVQSASAFSAAAVLSLRGAVSAGVVLHALVVRLAAIVAANFRLTARFALGLTVRVVLGLRALAVFTGRYAAGAGVGLARMSFRSAVLFATACKLTVRFALGLTVRVVLGLRALAVFTGRYAAGAGVALARMSTRLAAAVMVAVVRVAAPLRRSFAWLRRRLAESGSVSQRAWVVGLSAAIVVFVMLAVPWVQDSVPFPVIGEPPVVAAVPSEDTDIPEGRDLEDDVAVIGIPSHGPVSDPAPFPDVDGSVLSYLPNEDLIAPSAVPAPPRDPASTGLALLPERPRARPRRGRPQWLANAVEQDLRGAGPLIAIVIDDVGIDQKRTARTIDLPPPLTLAFIPYGNNLARHAGRASDRGHELIVHVPMEPSRRAADPGPNALLTGLDEEEIMRRFLWGLAQFDGYVGVSNHMGSRFMARGDLLEPLLAVTHQRGLLFLDSRTRADTAGSDIAQRLRLPNARRDVFLDNEITVTNVTAQLAEVERVARKQGHAVAIGHPHDITIDTLAKWIPEARTRGFTLVPISTIVRLDYGAEYGDRLAAAIPAGGETEGLLGRAQ